MTTSDKTMSKNAIIRDILRYYPRYSMEHRGKRDKPKKTRCNDSRRSQIENGQGKGMA